MSWLPHFHHMGLIGCVVGPLFTHVPCVFSADGPDELVDPGPQRIWVDKIHEHRGTITYAPSFAYALTAKRLKDKDLEGLDLSCLRVAGCGAEPIRARALQDFASRLAPAGFDAKAFLPSYGMAEATLALTFVPLGRGLRADHVDQDALTLGDAKPKAEGEGAREVVDCGVPFPGHDLAIIDETGAPVGDRRVGQIVVRGPSVTQGYFEDPELTAQTFRPLPLLADAAGPPQRPWLHTGDLGYTVDGSLYVCGRVKEIIIVRGRNYYPNDMEWAVGELPAVRRGNVVAFGIDVLGEEHVVLCCEGASGDAPAIGTRRAPAWPLASGSRRTTSSCRRPARSRAPRAAKHSGTRRGRCTSTGPWSAHGPCITLPRRPPDRSTPARPDRPPPSRRTDRPRERARTTSKPFRPTGPKHSKPARGWREPRRMRARPTTHVAIHDTLTRNELRARFLDTYRKEHGSMPGAPRCWKFMVKGRLVRICLPCSVTPRPKWSSGTSIT